LRYARRRKEEVFRPVDPVAAVHWLHGLSDAVDWADLIFPREAHARAMVRRGLTEGIAAEQLRERGLTPEQVVDEVLAIEIEAWESEDPEKREQEQAAFVGVFGEELCLVFQPLLSFNTIPDDGREVWAQAFGVDPTPEAVEALDPAGLEQLRATCER